MVVLAPSVPSWKGLSSAFVLGGGDQLAAALSGDEKLLKRQPQDSLQPINVSASSHAVPPVLLVFNAASPVFTLVTLQMRVDHTHRSSRLAPTRSSLPPADPCGRSVRHVKRMIGVLEQLQTPRRLPDAAQTAQAHPLANARRACRNRIGSSILHKCSPRLMTAQWPGGAEAEKTRAPNMGSGAIA
jgi:hypothetical protein